MPGRRIASRVILVGWLVIPAVLVGCRRSGQDWESRPATGTGDAGIQHVVLISIDTLRADHLRCYGHPFVKTPNIDRLAAEGILFEQHISAAPTTLNSHTSLMTGTWPHTHGTARNGFVVHDKNVMLAEVLGKAGFTTAAFVGAFPLHSRFNFGQGFDIYDEAFDVLMSVAPVDQDQRSAEAVTDRVLAWLDENDAERIFLFVHYFDVHWPYAPPPPYDLKYRSNDMPIGGSLMEIRLIRDALTRDAKSMPKQNAALDELYSGEVSYTDEHVGRLLDSLRERGILEKSLVILTSDHGEAMNEHWEKWNHGQSTYETTVRTPLIIRQPGGRGGGTRVGVLASNIDVVPTVLDRLGVACPVRVEGVSLAPLLDGGKGRVRNTVFSEATKPWSAEEESDGVWWNARKCRSIRTEGWKYIYQPVSGASELYEISADPEEERNLLVDPSEASLKRAADLRRRLETWAASAAPLPSQMDDSLETAEKLRHIGYTADDSDDRTKAQEESTNRGG